MKVRPGCQKYCILRCLGRPESAKKAKIFIVAGAPIRKKSDVRSRYVCVFVHVLMAKTTIGKSMCVCVFVSIRVCLCAIRVCVCVQSVCVCLWPIFHSKLRGLGACLKHCKGGHFRRVFTFKMTCSIRVCVCVLGVIPHVFYVENAT